MATIKRDSSMEWRLALHWLHLPIYDKFARLLGTVQAGRIGGNHHISIFPHALRRVQWSDFILEHESRNAHFDAGLQFGVSNVAVKVNFKRIKKSTTITLNKWYTQLLIISSVSLHWAIKLRLVPLFLQLMLMCFSGSHFDAAHPLFYCKYYHFPLYFIFPRASDYFRSMWVFLFLLL